MLVPVVTKGYMAVMNWKDLTDQKGTNFPVDLDLHASFNAGVGNCQVFYGQLACADTKHVVDGPKDLGTKDGLSGTVKALTEAVEITSLKATVYTLFVHNPTQIKATQAGNTAATKQLIDVSLQIFGPTGKVLDVRVGLQSSKL